MEPVPPPTGQVWPRRLLRTVTCSHWVRMVGQASYPVGDDDRNHDYTTSSTDPNTLTAMATDGLAPVHPLAREATWES